MEKAIQPMLCKCGFFGNKATGGMCSTCFKKSEEDKKQKEKEGPIIDPSEDSTKCYICHRKLGIYGVPCKCCHFFCKLHRHFDDHKCTYDYRKDAQKKLIEANPMIISNKMHQY